jgi:hypothetical protein
MLGSASHKGRSLESEPQRQKGRQKVSGVGRGWEVCVQWGRVSVWEDENILKILEGMGVGGGMAARHCSVPRRLGW